MKVAELKVLPVAVLKPAEYNPRKKLKPGDKEYEKIKASIEEFGFADPLVVNADMTIIGGHQRLTVAIDLGFTEVPCAVVDIDKTREKALNIALNKITGAWDENLLADLLKDIQESDFDLGKTGFDPPEIETLFNKVHSKDVKEDDFDVEAELQNPVFSKLGDLWCLGPHRVICGDSTGEEVYTRLMDGQKANLVLTDPPYNVDVEETAGKIMNDNMADADFYNFLLSAYRCMHANLADDGSIYVWHADTEGLNFRGMGVRQAALVQGSSDNEAGGAHELSAAQLHHDQRYRARPLPRQRQYAHRLLRDRPHLPRHRAGPEVRRRDRKALHGLVPGSRCHRGSMCAP